jgi:hypothetical protein
LILDTTLLRLEAVLAGAVAANQPECHVNYIQWNVDNVPTRPAVYRAALNNTTDVSILPAPTTQGIVREVTSMSIYNKDTANVTVTVKTDDGTTERIIVKQELLTTETLNWTRDAGWFII